jgi:hypothetical protein
MKTFTLVLTVLGLFMADAVAAAEPVPLPRGLELAGLHAYAEKIVTAGQTMHFRVSSTVPYELSI